MRKVLSFARSHYGDISAFVGALRPYVSEIHFADMRHPDYTPKFLSTPSILGQMSMIHERKQAISLTNNDNHGFWQRFACWYAPVMRTSAKLYNDIADSIRPKLNKQMNVLELACGSGQLSFSLASCVRLWEATDFSPAMIAEAKRVAPRPSSLFFSVHDATKLPYSEGSFDAVLIANALHIMPCPELALSEIRRVLKADGTLYAPTFVHGESRAFRFRVWLMERVGFHVFHEWSADQFADFLRENGFIVQEHKMIGTSLAPLCYIAATPKEGAA